MKLAIESLEIALNKVETTETTTEVWVRLNEWQQVKVTLKLEELEGWGEITTRKVGLTEAELIAEKLAAKDYQTTPYFDQ